MTPLTQLQDHPEYLELSEAVQLAFPRVDLPESDAAKARNGVRLATPIQMENGNVGVFGPDGIAIGIFDNSESELRALVVFASNE